jgi:signal-transduction protein with cAMP-binding, CBS, and nucleotidyltransferase domain
MVSDLPRQAALGATIFLEVSNICGDANLEKQIEMNILRCSE